MLWGTRTQRQPACGEDHGAELTGPADQAHPATLLPPPPPNLSGRGWQLASFPPHHLSNPWAFLSKLEEDATPASLGFPCRLLFASFFLPDLSSLSHARRGKSRLGLAPHPPRGAHHARPPINPPHRRSLLSQSICKPCPRLGLALRNRGGTSSGRSSIENVVGDGDGRRRRRGRVRRGPRHRGAARHAVGVLRRQVSPVPIARAS
jgi:hypothetical protein